jgi:hypothetical protein
MTIMRKEMQTTEDINGSFVETSEMKNSLDTFNKRMDTT